MKHDITRAPGPVQSITLTLTPSEFKDLVNVITAVCGVEPEEQGTPILKLPGRWGRITNNRYGLRDNLVKIAKEVL